MAVTVKNERGQVLNALEERYYTLRKINQMSIRRDRPGNWTVSLQRCWYRPVTIQGIRVVEDEYGPVRPTPLSIQLKPTSDAPHIREFPIFLALSDGLLVGFWPCYR